MIVDTGSPDNTQNVIRKHMANLGIGGELYERPWHDFGHNRTEALTLAQGHGDYIWVIDADDLVVGTPDFSGLTADVYLVTPAPGRRLHLLARQLFRDGKPWRYKGVVHEYAECDEAAYDEQRIEGDYYIESRRLGGRNKDPEKYARDRDLLLAEVERNPEDARSVFYLGSELSRHGRSRQRTQVVCAAGRHGRWLGRGALLCDVPSRRVDVQAR